MSKQEIGRSPEEEKREDAPLYAQKQDRTGGTTLNFAGEDAVGEIYYLEIGDRTKEYILVKEGKNKGKVYDEENKEPVEDASINEKIENMERRNRAIFEARVVRSEELANGNEALEEALLWHMDYKNGDVGIPKKVNGIDFYQVGHNASAVFFVGTEGDRKFVLVYDYDQDEKEVQPREVDDWEYGYHGHY